MPKFLELIQSLDTSSPPSAAQPRLEPRRTRRQKARTAAKAQATRSLGAAAAQPNSTSSKLKKNW